MASETVLLTKTYTVNQSGGVLAGYAANLHTTRGQVALGSSNSEHFAGVFEASSDNSKDVSVAKAGIVKAKAGAAITLRKYCVVDSTGRFIALPINATPVEYNVVGKCEEAAGAAGDYFDMHIICPPIKITS